MLQGLAVCSRLVVCSLVVLPLVAVSSCSPQSRTENGARAFSSLSLNDPDVRCVSDPTASDSVSFSAVDLGRLQREAAQQERVLTGHRTRTVILDSLAWPSAWRAAVDTVPAPRVAFGRDALVLAATQTYTVGPIDFSIVAIRKCRSTQAVVIGLREKARYSGGEDYGSRGLSVVRVPRSELAGVRVEFVDLRE